jgi:chromosome partitioning protein
MPTIVFACGKGGVGKTTSALLVATALAKLYPVTLVDADPNQPIKFWATSGNTPPLMTIISDVTEQNISGVIDDAASTTPFVVVDLEGTASKIVLYAIEQADFVIIPMQASPLDAKEASRAIGVVLEIEKATGKNKPYAVLFTRTSTSIRTRSLTHIRKELTEAGVPILRTELNEREAFKAIMAFQQTLDGLNTSEVPNLNKAKVNVLELAEEVFQRLSAEQGDGKEQSKTKMAGAA